MAKSRKTTKPGYKVRMSLTPPRIHGLHELSAIPAFGQTRMTPPGWLLDKLAEEKLLGGYSRKDPTCKTCFVKKSKNGTCNC